MEKVDQVVLVYGLLFHIGAWNAFWFLLKLKVVEAGRPSFALPLCDSYGDPKLLAKQGSEMRFSNTMLGEWKRKGEA